MALTPQQFVELDRLLADLADGRLDAHGFAVLEGLLRSDAEAQDHYIRFLALCSDLHDAAALALSTENDASPKAIAAIEELFPDRTIAGGHAGARQSRPPKARRWLAVGATAAACLLAMGLLAVFGRWLWERAGSTNATGLVMGRLEALTGAVEVGQVPDAVVRATIGQPLEPGQSVVTRDAEAHAAIRLWDGTLLMLSGQTEVVFPRPAAAGLRLERGNLVAEVPPRPAGQPLVICTNEASLDVLGTRLTISRHLDKTQVAVLQGQVRVRRLSDQREMKLQSGQASEVSAETDLRPLPVEPVPDHWSLDFNAGLPVGWQTGQLVFEDLPDRSKAAVRASRVMENGRIRNQIRSHNAWSCGLFSLQHDSWLHIRYRMEKPGTFLFYLVCRQADFGRPVCTVLTPGNLRQTVSGQWHTITLAADQFHRTRTQDPVPLDGQLVAFLLVFDSPEHDPGLTVERIWVTRGTPASPRPPIEPQEALPLDAAP